MVSPRRPLGQRRHRQHAHLGGGGGAAQDEIHQRRLVDHRIGVGHHDDGGDAARRRGRAGRFQGFAMFGARLAGKDAAVDQAGRQHQPAAVDHFGIIAARHR